MTLKIPGWPVPSAVDVVVRGVSWVIPAPIALVAGISMVTLAVCALVDPISIRSASLDRRESDLLRWDHSETAKLNVSVSEIDEALRPLREEALLRGIPPEVSPAPPGETPAEEAARLLGESVRLTRALAAQASSQGLALTAMLPSRSPIDFKEVSGTAYISSLEGPRIDPFSGAESVHKGLDISAIPGTPVLATADGRVLFAGIVDSAQDHAASLLGNYVEVEHGKTGFRTLYAHLSRIDVKEGQAVRGGECIGAVGTTGHSTAPHLHYQVIQGGAAVDPLAFITDVDLVRDGAMVRFTHARLGS